MYEFSNIIILGFHEFARRIKIFFVFPSLACIKVLKYLLKSKFDIYFKFQQIQLKEI